MNKIVITIMNTRLEDFFMILTTSKEQQQTLGGYIVTYIFLFLQKIKKGLVFSLFFTRVV